MAKANKKASEETTSSKKYTLSKDGTSIERLNLNDESIKSYEARGWKVEEI